MDVMCAGKEKIISRFYLGYSIIAIALLLTILSALVAVGIVKLGNTEIGRAHV